AEYTYDSRFRRATKRVSGVVTSYAYDHNERIGDDLVEERKSGGGIVKYYYGPQVDELLGQQAVDNAVLYLLSDRIGSIAQATTSLVMVTSVRVYDPFGRLSGDT